MEENKPTKPANRSVPKNEPDVRLLHSITLRNILSFGPDTPELKLRALNVLIGPNGSGKSNLLDCIGLLQSAPDKLAETVRTEGSVREWLWKGSKNATARVETVVAQPRRPMGIRHWFEFRESDLRFELVEERIEAEKATAKSKREKPFLFFGYEHGQPTLNVQQSESTSTKSIGLVGVTITTFKRTLRREDIDPELSILSQRRDPDQYPELTFLGDTYPKIRLYRNWIFGRDNPARGWQDTAGRNDYLTPNADNLALMLSRLRGTPEIKQRIKELLNELYEGITSFDVQVFGGRMQAYLEEGNTIIPASRLSDGTLRFLFLIAILLHPTPPPLICLEEPELGLHPDAVVAVGKLIKEASTRTQLIVTTHSRMLIDTLTDSPEDVIVCGKRDGSTVMERLKSEELTNWLTQYGSLGNLWSRGFLGDEAGNGNRW